MHSQVRFFQIDKSYYLKLYKEFKLFNLLPIRNEKRATKTQVFISKYKFGYIFLPCFFMISIVSNIFLNIFPMFCN